MILTTKQHLARYRGLNSNLDIALDYILKEDLPSLPLGCTHIVEDAIYVNHFKYESQPESESFLEGHQAYLDIHLVVTGREYLAYCDSAIAKILQPYDEEHDLYKYQANIRNYACLDENYLAITFPEDAHQPKILVHQSEHVDKLVFKVRLG